MDFVYRKQWTWSKPKFLLYNIYHLGEKLSALFKRALLKKNLWWFSAVAFLEQFSKLARLYQFGWDSISSYFFRPLRHRLAASVLLLSVRVNRCLLLQTLMVAIPGGVSQRPAASPQIQATLMYQDLNVTQNSSLELFFTCLVWGWSSQNSLLKRVGHSSLQFQQKNKTFRAGKFFK